MSEVITNEVITSEAIAKAPGFAPPRRFDSEEAFEAWCDEDIRAEYLNGEVIMHCPAGTVHEKSIQWFWFWQQPLPNMAAIVREMGIL